VLFVSLASAAVTHALGLSMAFGAFLAGTMIGDTDFRHQVESAIRPFRDVLLGLFFVGIGMLFDPAAALRIWPWALGGTVALLAIKAVAVAAIVRVAGGDPLSAWRTGLILAGGGEFGFALVAIAVASNTVDANVAQVALTSVLLSMIAGPFLIRHNHAIARRLASPRRDREDTAPLLPPADAALLSAHVIICGYGRIGQSVGHVLEDEKIPYVALDLDAARVRQATRVGERVFYADGSDPDILDAVGLATARLVVVCHDDVPAAMRLLAHVRNARSDLPVMVRTRDESHVEALRAAGATEVVPETLEAGLMIATHALLLLDVPIGRVVHRLQGRQSARYRLLHEFFRGTNAPADAAADHGDRPHAVVVPTSGSVVGRSLSDLGLRQVVVAVLVRRGRRLLAPPPELPLEGGDTVVLFGAPGDTAEAERVLLA
jgi:CPA2 family monovalent cation:H+ antiporter-2